MRRLAHHRTRTDVRLLPSLCSSSPFLHGVATSDVMVDGSRMFVLLMLFVLLEVLLLRSRRG